MDFLLNVLVGALLAIVVDQLIPEEASLWRRIFTTLALILAINIMIDTGVK